MIVFHVHVVIVLLGLSSSKTLWAILIFLPCLFSSIRGGSCQSSRYSEEKLFRESVLEVRRKSVLLFHSIATSGAVEAFAGSRQK